MDNSKEQPMEWKSSEQVANPFRDGEYYHLGCKGMLSGNFVYKGIYKYTDRGFLDDNGYNLRPGPTHYIHLPIPNTKP